MKKIKGHFCSPSNLSNPSHPSHQITGNKESILEIPLKLMTFKILMHFNFMREILLKLNRPEKSKMGNFSQKGLSICHVISRSTFSMIFKKSYLEGVFDFIYPDSQLVQIFKPTRNLSGHFFYKCISLYKYSI